MSRETTFGIVLWATDVGAMADFLVDVAGARLLERHPGFAALQVPGCHIEVHADETFRGHPWFEALAREGVARGIGAELVFPVDDVLAAFRAAVRRGAQVIAQPYEFEGRLECQVMGPDGYVFGLWQAWNPATSG
jgi:catechol 2,3-dioxygenase-like lactoylglutathione lyase family enzyme